MKTLAPYFILALCTLSQASFLSRPRRAQPAPVRTYNVNPRSLPENKSEKPPEKETKVEADVYYLHVISDIRSRFATTVVTSRVANPTDEALEVVFNVILPTPAFISNFSMEIGGEVVVGVVKEKEEAKADYEAAKAQGQSAGLVAQAPRETNRFEISVNVEAASKVSFNLTYQELLKRVHGVYKHVVNIQPGQVVEDLKVSVAITEKGKIEKLTVPGVKEKMGEKTNKELLDKKGKGESEEPESVSIFQTTQDDISIAQIDYSPSLDEQGINGSKGLNAQLVVLYDMDRENTGGTIQVVNGYFVHFFAPSGLQVGNKHVIFVLDKSGSMQGQKLEQTKTAMKRILSDLDETDYFNIIEFADRATLWKSESVAAAPDNIASAKDYVQSIDAFGGTNINDALLLGVETLNETMTSALTSMVIFLTDGEATSGEVLDANIIANLVSANTNQFPVHSVGFGSGADYNLLKKISYRNNGLARKVYADSDADLQLEGFYAEIGSPLLTDVKIEYLNETVEPGSLLQDHSYNYYEGGEYVIAGKLASDQDFEVVPLSVMVNARSALGAESYRVICPFPPHPPIPIPYPTEGPLQAYKPLPAETIGGFVERTWAYLTIKKVLETMKYGEDNSTVKEQLKQKALDLSLKYNFVTELTSMVVTQPGETNRSQALSEREESQDRETQFQGTLHRQSSKLAYRRGSFSGRASAMHFKHVAGLPGPSGPGGMPGSHYGVPGPSGSRYGIPGPPPLHATFAAPSMDQYATYAQIEAMTTLVFTTPQYPDTTTEQMPWVCNEEMGQCVVASEDPEPGVSRYYDFDQCTGNCSIATTTTSGNDSSSGQVLADEPYGSLQEGKKEQDENEADEAEINREKNNEEADEVAEESNEIIEAPKPKTLLWQEAVGAPSTECPPGCPPECFEAVDFKGCAICQCGITPDPEAKDPGPCREGDHDCPLWWDWAGKHKVCACSSNKTRVGYRLILPLSQTASDLPQGYTSACFELAGPGDESEHVPLVQIPDLDLKISAQLASHETFAQSHLYISKIKSVLKQVFQVMDGRRILKQSAGPDQRSRARIRNFPTLSKPAVLEVDHRPLNLSVFVSRDSKSYCECQKSARATALELTRITGTLNQLKAIRGDEYTDTGLLNAVSTVLDRGLIELSDPSLRHPTEGILLVSAPSDQERLSANVKSVQLAPDQWCWYLTRPLLNSIVEFTTNN